MESFLQWISIVSPTVACFMFLWNEIKSLEAKLDRHSDRLDKQAERTDKLYEMFIDLLKAKK